ncbi:MAG: hypothetical protein IME97_04480, partial [Proteobacteria bacterium]|nr:hypothetical protein [Pseudomonadota bacterium]
MSSIRKTISVLFILVLSVSALGLIYIYNKLPTYIEDRARQVLLQKTPFTRFDANVRHAGLYGLKIDNIEAGDARHPTLSIDSIDIKYTPTDLLKKRIKGIDVTGLTFFLELHDGHLSIPGLDSLALEGGKTQTSTEINMPVDLQELQVKEGMLHLTVDSEKMLIPFNLTLKQESFGRPSFYKTLLQLYPGSEQVTFAADIDLADNQGLVKLSSKILPLEKLAPFIRTLPGLMMAGQASMNGVSEIKLQPTEAVSAGIEIVLQPFTLTFNDIQVESPLDIQDSKPIKLIINYNKEKLQYKIDDISLTKPIGAIFNASGALALSENQFAGAGEFTVAVKDIPSFTIKESVRLSNDLT